MLVDMFVWLHAKHGHTFTLLHVVGLSMLACVTAHWDQRSAGRDEHSTHPISVAHELQSMTDPAVQREGHDVKTLTASGLRLCMLESRR